MQEGTVKKPPTWPENSQRYLEESIAERERSRLNMVSRLDKARTRAVGEDSGQVEAPGSPGLRDVSQ